MPTILWRTIKDRKVSLIVYLGAALLFVWMYVAMFPAIERQADAFAAVFENFPPAVFEVFGIEDLNMSTLENFFSVEHFSLVLPIMVILLMVSVGGRSIAGEVELGTVELLIGRPVSRTKLYLAKYLSGVGILVAFTLISVFSTIPLAALHGVDYQIPSFAAGALILFLFGWGVFSVAMMFSSLFSEKGKVYMACGGVLLAMYVLNVVALLRESLDALKYLSFFHYYAYSDALVRQSIYATGAFVLAAASIVCSVIGLVWFLRRDVAV